MRYNFASNRASRPEQLPTTRGRRRSRLAGDDGFTLFEVLIATVILVVGLTSLFGLLDVTVKASSATKAREGATSLAREIVEDARTIPYAQLSPTSIVGQLQAMNGLADASSAAGWQVVRSGVTYTVTVSECSIDDPKDGYGKHVNSFGENPFCNEPGEKEGTEDLQPADLKRITVDVTWPGQGRTPRVHQVAMLTAAGEAPGLSASGLHLITPQPEPPSSPTAPVVSQVVSPLIFSVSSPAGTAAMSWSLNGSAQTPAPTRVKGTETEWTFEWPISGISDGTYQVSAQAIDTTGVTGPPVSISVNLIRGQPAAPSGIIGGFNTINVSGVPTKVAELQWHANSERNVIGYRVYRPGEPAGGEPGEGPSACPGSLATLSLALSCIDFNPPTPNATNLNYSVVALYHDKNGEVRQSPAASFTLAVVGESAPPGPNPPKNLALEKNANGSVTLSWEKPSSGGPAVIFYRIYRGSTDYTSRYDVTSSGTSVTYTDNDAATTHTYWVTAVDAHLTESSFLGPVSG